LATIVVPSAVEEISIRPAKMSHAFLNTSQADAEPFCVSAAIAEDIWRDSCSMADDFQAGHPAVGE
jgi:hypothetical protein